MIKDILGELDGFKSTLTNSLVSVFSGMKQEIYNVMDNLGERKEEYHISIYPFSIERFDKKPVPKNLLMAIREALSCEN